MKVLVLGAGVAGVSSAWYLAEAGHEVTVIDRAKGVAMETSFANAGQLSYGYTTPWAAPGIPTKALKWLFKSHPPLLFRPDGSLYQIEWLWQMLQNCTAARYQINKERMVRISEYSREMFRRFEAQTGMNFEGRKKGTLQIFRQAKEVKAAEQDIAVLERYGVPYRRLKPEECAEFEPALARVTAKLPAACICLQMRPATATSSLKTYTNCVRRRAYSFISTKPSAASTTTGCASKPLKPKQNGLKQMPSSARSAALAGLCWRSWISICPFIPSKAIP